MLLPRKLFNQQQQQHCPPPPAAQTSKLQLQRSSNQLFICVFFSTLPRDYAAAATQRGRSFLVLLFLFGCFYQHNEGGRRIASLAAGWGCAQAVFSFWCVCGCGCGCGCLSVCAFFLFLIYRKRNISRTKTPTNPNPNPNPDIEYPKSENPASVIPPSVCLLPSSSSFRLRLSVRLRLPPPLSSSSPYTVPHVDFPPIFWSSISPILALDFPPPPLLFLFSFSLFPVFSPLPPLRYYPPLLFSST